MIWQAIGCHAYACVSMSFFGGHACLRKCRHGTRRRPAFTLMEVMAALAILALTASSVLFVVNQNVSSAADSVRRMEAFQLARENMERVLTSASVTESVEFGTSEIYPDITWRTVIEAFSEPAGGTMWLRAVCTADFADSTGQTQKVELVHWLTALTEQQAQQFLQDEERPSLSAEQLIDDVEGAAKYAGVEIATLEQWLANGLLTTSTGSFIRYNLDIFVRSKGSPSDAVRAQQVHSLEELASVLKDTAGGQSDTPRTDRQGPVGDGAVIRSGVSDPGQTGMERLIQERSRNR